MAAIRPAMEFIPPHKQVLNILLGGFNSFTGDTAGQDGISSGMLHGTADDNLCQLYWGLLLKHILRQH